MSSSQSVGSDKCCRGVGACGNSSSCWDKHGRGGGQQGAPELPHKELRLGAGTPPAKADRSLTDLRCVFTEWAPLDRFSHRVAMSMRPSGRMRHHVQFF